LIYSIVFLLVFVFGYIEILTKKRNAQIEGILDQP
jgi:hypothetical protein